ncbi:calcium/sodium antiporter [Fodinicurvata fenggangensis]|uniref:calcium/sodium antiporter n=1 Tax=Fodinicurvata fenggangensis TaxID=1121830 RepID=UPI00055397B5|nr:calcium/sodium antiporter [Fodinicurvata fenggangensis]
MTWLFIVAGLGLLLLGGEMLVRGAVASATRLGISPLLVGLTLVGFGTSTPELLTSINAALSGSPGIAVGNVVGSNIANILLILGLSALLSPLLVDPAALKRDGAMLLVVSLAACLLVPSGEVTAVMGGGMVATLMAYVVWCYLQESRSQDAGAHMHRHEAEAFVPVHASPLWRSLTMALIGLACTLAGAKLLVSGAIELAAAAGLSETLIGLTIVAVGTSLPELVTSVMAALRRQSDVAFGNIVGSNLFNLLGILGVTALVEDISIPQKILDRDLWVMLGATLLLLVAAWSGCRLSRLEGGIFLGGYLVYIAVLVTASG